METNARPHPTADITPTIPVYPDPPGAAFQAAAVPPQPASARARQGPLGWLAAAFAAVFGGLKFLAFLPFAKTAITMVISFGAYLWFGGPVFAAALVVMIFLHEMGHVVEIRRQGMQASAPIFIPFLGAAIFQRTHATDVVNQARIGIAGPIAGTAAAAVAYVLYGATLWTPFLFAAYIGFWINLINLIPAGMLDGGWILAPVSKWFQAFGLGLIVVLGLLGFIGPLFILVVLMGLPHVIARFRHAQAPYYRTASRTARWTLGGAWLALVIFLGAASVLTHGQLCTVTGIGGCGL